MVSRSIHSAMMIYSAHMQTQRGRQTQINKQTCTNKTYMLYIKGIQQEADTKMNNNLQTQCNSLSSIAPKIILKIHTIWTSSFFVSDYNSCNLLCSCCLPPSPDVVFSLVNLYLSFILLSAVSSVFCTQNQSVIYRK